MRLKQTITEVEKGVANMVPIYGWDECGRFENPKGGYSCVSVSEDKTAYLGIFTIHMWPEKHREHRFKLVLR